MVKQIGTRKVATRAKLTSCSTMRPCTAKQAARRWSHTEFDAAIVSPLARADETEVVIMLGDRDLELVTVEDIKETDGGAWEGLVFTDIAEEWPDEHAAFRLPGLDSGPVGGETPRRIWPRTANAVVAALVDADVLVVVSHATRCVLPHASC